MCWCGKRRPFSCLDGGGGQKMEQNAPWYRYRWPWILIAGPAVVVVASVVTFWIATDSNDALVTGDYYKQGLAINEDLARVQMAHSLGLSASLRASPTAWELALRAREGVGLPEKLIVSFSHATRQDLDQAIELTQSSPGFYSGERRELSPGRWDILLADGNRTWRLATTVQAPLAGEVVFRPKAASAPN